MRSILALCLFLIATSEICAQKLQTVIQRGHLAAIKSVAYTPDGKFLLTASRDKTIKLWEIETGLEMRTYFGHQHTVNNLDIAKDGKSFVSSSADGTAIRWDIASGEIINRFEIHEDFLTDVSLSEDNERLVTAGFDNKAYLWDLSTGDTLRSFKVNPDKGLGFGVNIGIRNDRLYVGNDNRTITAYQLESGNLELTLTPKEGWCGGCATFLSIKGDTLFYTSNGLPLLGLNLTTKDTLVNIGSATDDNRDLDATESKIAHLTDGALTVMNYKGDTLFTLKADEDINDISFSPDGQQLTLVKDDMSIVLLNAQTGNIQKILGGFAVNRDVGGLDYNADSRWDYYIKKYTDLSNDFSLSPDGKYLAKAKIGSIVRIWELETGKIFTELRGHEKAVLAVAFSASGDRIITGSADETIKVWDVKTGKVLRTLEGHRGVIFNLAFSANEEQIISGSWDGTARTWDFKSGELKQTYVFEQASPYHLSFYQGDIYALIAGLDKTLKLFELDSKTVVRDFIGHTDVIHAFDFHDKLLASVSWDGTAKVWNISNGLQQWRHKNDEPLYAVAINPAGTQVAIAGANRNILLYDLNSGKELYTLSGHQSSITNLKFDLEGKKLISSSEDGMIKIWNLEQKEVIISYIAFDNGDWLAINGDGYFNASEGAYDKVAFVSGLKSYSLDQFFRQYYQPDLLKKAFGKRQTRSSLQQQLQSTPPPSIEIVTPHDGDQMKSEVADIIIRAKDEGGGIRSIRLKHNGKTVADQEVKTRNGMGVLSFKLPLIPGTNKIEASARNAAGLESGLEKVNVTKEGKLNTTLYVLAIGINHYENESLNLNYARADAEGFVDLVSKRSKTLFDRVEVLKILDEEATREEILSKLNVLSKLMKPQDVLFFYYAGHGSMVDNEFYFVPTDNTKLYSSDKLAKTGIRADELQAKLREIAALKQLLIIDACQSGGSVEVLATRGASEEKAMAQLSRSTGIHVLAAAGSEQFATEFTELKHGLFTYVLLEALSGKADGAPKDGKVTIYELKSYLDDQVPEFSRQHKGKMQFPHTFSRGQDFPIIVDENE